MALVRAAQQTSSSSNTCPSHHHHHHGCIYDVFLSFRGEDTRKNFTDHLYTAFVDHGLRTFRDDDEIERGEHLNPELQKAIQQSRSSVIVFSKDYASSKWCLDEVVMILQRKRTSNNDHVVLPVFYDVDPTHVRKQTGSFAKAFSRHQKSQSKEKVKDWRTALAQAADLAGMVLQNEVDGYEAKFVKKIIKVIEGKLIRTPLSVVPKMFGISSQAKNINLWLQDRSTNVGILVIYGMPGIGKTTLAKFLYDSNLREYEAMSFLANIRDTAEQPNGIVQIQEQLLSSILKRGKIKIQSVSEGMRRIGDAISSKRVLMVLDDVDNMEQLDAVLRMQHQFYPGSKIIITTRRARLSKAPQVTKVHEVKILNDNESLELFSWHAFGKDHPIDGYKDLSEKVVHRIGGLPLALQLLGSSLMGESIEAWESALKRLEAIQDSQIMNKLRISYDSLQDEHDKKLFLHISCFFIGKDKDYIVRILDGCDFFTIIGIQNLIDRCLARIDAQGRMEMHDMIRDMGRGIVRLESEELGERSRLWNHKDSFKVLKEKNGTEKVEGLVLNTHVLIYLADIPINSNEIVLETNAFARMRKLRLLQLSHIQLNGCYSEFPTGLRWLCWLKFPLDSIPTDFPLESLVFLEMQYSKLKQVWQGTNFLPSLKILDLSNSDELTKTGDFSLCPNLEKLILAYCTSLIDVHESIGNLNRLVYLNMEDCRNLRMLPKNMVLLKSLETLIISGCSNLHDFPMEMMKNMESLKAFEANEISLNQLLSNSGEMNSLPGRSLCVSWTCLPCSLISLSLQGCNLMDDAFSVDFGYLSSLQSLNLSENPICSLPNSIKGIESLRQLTLMKCTRLKSLEELPGIHNLNVHGCKSLEKITFQSISSESITKTIFWESPNLVELGHRFKYVPIGEVDVELMNLLGLCNLESLSTMQLRWGMNWAGRQRRPIQGLYEYGIFSTFLPGDKVPGRFSHRSRELTSISFTVPNNKIRGLNVFVVSANSVSEFGLIELESPILIKVKNKSKGVKWIYGPICYGVPDVGEDMVWLSHWNLENQLGGGDEVVVSVFMPADWLKLKEWGIELIVHVQEENNTSSQHNNTTEDLCNPFVIGGDLSAFEVMPKTFLLWWTSVEVNIEMLTTVVGVFITDSDEETVPLVKEDEKVEDDPTLAAATRGGDSNKCSIRGWKVLIMAAAFFLPLCLFFVSFSQQNKEQQQHFITPT